FDQLERTVPYGAIVQALGRFVRQLLAEPEANLAVWRNRLREGLGANGRALAHAMPELEQVLGALPALPDLSPQQTQTRFQRTVAAFLRAVAAPEHPFVVFIDDLQWADPSTPSLLTNLLCDAGLKHTLFILAFRDNEVGAEHIVARALAEIEAAKPHAVARV